MAGIRIELQLEDGSFTSGMLRAGQSMRSFKSELARLDPHFRTLSARGQDSFRSFKQLDDGSKTLMGRLRDLTVVAHGAALAFRTISGATSGIIGNIINVNAEMERLRFQLAGMSQATDPMKDAAAQVHELQEQAKNAPFSFRELTNTFVKLKVSGIDPMNGSLQALIDGIAAFGGNDEAFHRITLGITQMAGKGVIQMEELRQQLGESMPSAMKLMARSMGVSIAELTKMIATGRVEAQAALSSWFQEVDLSYGGSASQMMKTFSGQMARIRTSFVQRVTTGEMGSAFEELKKTMGDIVTILESPQAAEFFDGLGRGLKSALDLSREVAASIMQLRGYIEKASAALPYLIGGAVVTAIGRRMVGAVNAARVAWVGLSTSIKASVDAVKSMTAASLAAERANARAAMVAAAAAAKGKSGSSLRDSAEWAGAIGMMADVKRREGSVAARVGTALSRGLGPAISIVGRLASLLGPIAMTVGVIAPLAWQIGKGIYSWFTGASKAKDEIDKTLKSIQQQTITDQNKELDALRKRQDAEMDVALRRREQESRNYSDYFERYGKDNPSMLASIEREQKRIDDLLEKHEAERTEVMKRHAAAREQMRQERVNQEIADARALVSEETQAGRKAYNYRMEVLAKAAEAAESDVRENGGSMRSVREQREEWTRRVQKARLDDLRVATLEQIRLAEERVKANTGEAETVELLREDLKKLDDQIEALNSKEFGIKLLTAPEDETKKIQRLVNFVNSAKDKTNELSAEINGASGALAKLMYQIRRGDFGNLQDGTREAEFLRYELIEATVAAEALQEMMNAQSKFSGNLTREIENMREEAMKLKAIQEGGLDPDDPTFGFKYLQWQHENGLSGIGRTTEEVMRQTLQKVTQGVGDAIIKFNDLDALLRQKAFGEENQVRVRSMAEQMERMATAAAGVGEALKSANLDGVMNGTAGFLQNIPNMIGGLWNGSALGSLVDRIIGVESGGDATAKNPNSSATGAGQFIDSTWLRMMGKYRPDLTAGKSREEILELRKNTALSREMVGRLAAENGSYLGARGHATTPGNLYLAHFLGAEGASKALGSNPIAKVADVLGQSVVKANPFLKNFTIADLQSWASRKMDGVRTAGTYAMLSADSQEQLRNSASSIVTQNDAQLAEGNEVAADLELRKAREKRREWEEKLKKEVAAAAASDENPSQGKTERELIDAILGGEINFGDRDPKSKQYQALLDQARKADKLRQSTKEQRKAEAEILREEEKLQERQLELAQKTADTRAQIKDPNYTGASKEMLELQKQEKSYLDAVEKRYGKQSQEYQAAVQRMADARKQLTTAEGAEAMLSLKQSTEAAEKEAMTERERRQRDYREEMDAAAAQRDLAIRNGEDRVRVEEFYQRQVSAIRQKYARESRTAFAAEVEESKKIDESLKAVAGNLPSQMADALYTQDWSSFGDAVREGIARSLTSAASGALLGLFTTLIEGEDGNGGLIGAISNAVKKLPGMVKGSGGGGGTGLLGGIWQAILEMFSKGGVGTAHTGAIIGFGGGGRTMASVADFIGAPKFHTGGIVGNPGMKFSSNLRRDKVPIIAKRKEGVFTPEQMKHLGGTMLNSQSISIAPTIQVNASGGTPEQNEDLARQISSETERAMRNLVRDELVRNMRPGGMLR